MKELEQKILELWHTRVPGTETRYGRMIYVRDWLLKENLDLVKKYCPPFESKTDFIGYSPKRLRQLIEKVTTVF